MRTEDRRGELLAWAAPLRRAVAGPAAAKTSAGVVAALLVAAGLGVAEPEPTAAQATDPGRAAPVADDEPARSPGIVAVPGIRAGHFTYADAATGCTVVIADGGAVGGVDVRGGAPGTVETDLLNPVATVQTVNAVLLAGGSAFGLAARDGVVRRLEEMGEGFRVGEGLTVPIVPGAVIFDLRVAATRPGAECGYRAAAAADEGSGRLAEGSVGAGAGASVGKLRGMAWAMKGGVGTASISLESGLVVGAVVVVNAVGDVIDPRTGRVVAGARAETGGFADARRILRGQGPRAPAGLNTTIGVVATNARLDQSQATKVAQMAQDGLARALVPSHAPGDGDAIFSLATGRLASGFDTGQVGALAAEVVAEAILRAVRAATGLPGLPAVKDLPGS